MALASAIRMGTAQLLRESPFIDRDVARPNEAYFKNIDYVVNRVNELGLGMGLVTAEVVARQQDSRAGIQREERLQFRQVPRRALQGQRRHMVSGRRLRSRKGRRGLGGDGEGFKGRQRRHVIDLLSRVPRRHPPRPGTTKLNGSISTRSSPATTSGRTALHSSARIMLCHPRSRPWIWSRRMRTIPPAPGSRALTHTRCTHRLRRRDTSN